MIKRIVISSLLLCALAVGQTSTGKAAAGAKKSGSAAAAEAKTATPKKAIWNPDEIQWGAPPPFLQPEAQFAVIEGDPSKAGVYTIRAKMPDGYKIQPHWHPTAENVTVLSGTLKVGMG